MSTSMATESGGMTQQKGENDCPSNKRIRLTGTNTEDSKSTTMKIDVANDNRRGLSNLLSSSSLAGPDWEEEDYRTDSDDDEEDNVKKRNAGASANNNGSHQRRSKLTFVKPFGIVPSISTQRVAFGLFKGRDIYRNAICVNETNKQGFFRLPELILPGCTSALVTSFGTSGTAYLGKVFAGIDNLMVVTPSSPDETHAILGNGYLKLMMPQKPMWKWLKTRPHTEGILHAKLLLFRSHEGLRVVVGGNNLTKHQWEGQRDCFWVQDFPTWRYEEDPPDENFQERLHLFLRDVTKCGSLADQAEVTNHVFNVLLHDIDFSNPNAELVFSVPRRDKEKASDRGGYKQLAKAVKVMLKNTPGMKLQSKGVGVVFGTSGSAGNLEPDFLWLLQNAMEGIDISKETRNLEWSRVHDNFRFFWPSERIASESDLVGLNCLRCMPVNHTYTIPSHSHRKILHEAIPNPDSRFRPTLPGEPRPVQGSYYPVTHGKFLWNKTRGVLYVGSHNCSKAAWGLYGQMPKNVELGVVLASPDRQQHQAWVERLPCRVDDDVVQTTAALQPFVSKTSSFMLSHPMANDWKLWKQRQGENILNTLGFIPEKAEREE